VETVTRAKIHRLGLKTRLPEPYRSLEDYLGESGGKLLAGSISLARAVPARYGFKPSSTTWT
jgi:hypothetical protein